VLRSLGYAGIATYHMNEGHAALLALRLLEQDIGEANVHLAIEADIHKVRHRCVFTTHTPVPAGQDQFSLDMMRQVLGDERTSLLEVTHCCADRVLNMTFLALRFFTAGPWHTQRSCAQPLRSTAHSSIQIGCWINT
jgi:glycogen phosphorylase